MVFKFLTTAGLCCVLAGCNTPSREFSQAEAQTVTVGTSTFDVRRIGAKVELIRTSAEFAPTLSSVLPQATQAVVEVTGCAPRPESWTGEQTIMQVLIDC